MVLNKGRLNLWSGEIGEAEGICGQRNVGLVKESGLATQRTCENMTSICMFESTSMCQNLYLACEVHY